MSKIYRVCSISIVFLSTILAAASWTAARQVKLGHCTLKAVIAELSDTAQAAQSSKVQTHSVIDLSFEDAHTILLAVESALPAELKGHTPDELQSLWPKWITRHDQQTRARLTQGDEDTLVNFLVLGTSFTRQPRLTATEFAQVASSLTPSQKAPDGSPASGVLFKRIDDLIHGLANPGANERLLFLAHLVQQQGYDPRAAENSRLKSYLLSNVGRVFREQQRLQIIYEQARQKDNHAEDVVEVSTLYRSRGVSLDTALWPNLAIEDSLRALRASGVFSSGSIRRAAVIGPGLDFTDKLGGYDFYPQQTIQCFALMDSLFRLGLAKHNDLQVITFDISERVNEHLMHLRERNRTGKAYVIQLPRNAQASWTPASTVFWRQFGDQIGAPVAPIRHPVMGEVIETRAVQLRPAAISIVHPMSLNIVTQHLDLAPQDGFDLIIGTNIFAYFDSFEQLLAVANAKMMLRPGGILLSNNALPLLPNSQMRLIQSLPLSYSDRPNDGDVISWYQRSPE